jgi:hypothetical protein
LLRRTEGGTGSDYESIIDGFTKRSEEIMHTGFIQTHYKEYANGLIFDYLEKIQGRKSFFYKIGKKLLKKSFSKQTFGTMMESLL